MDKKTVILGSFPESAKKTSKLTVKVEIEIRNRPENDDNKPRLSIVGEVGYPGARDCESAGQIQHEVRRLLAADLREQGTRLNYPHEKIARLLDIWERWHLNDMRPGCEHQRATWDPSAKIELVTYKLKTATLIARQQQERNALRLLAAGGTVMYNIDELLLASYPYEVVLGADQPAPGPQYDVAKRETETAGWVRPDEHPAGILTKPCPTCGYKYGSAWLYEPLPADVVAFLEDF
jgi:hypothetical protein